MSSESSGYEPRIESTGEGTPVVLVPGIDGTGLLFHRQVPLLASDHRVTTYRLRDDASSMAVLVEDLRRVVDTTSGAGASAVVVGESFGGALALSFALAHPDRVRRLVVINSFPYFEPQIRLRLGVHGLRAMPWGAMPLARRLTAFRLHSGHTHRHEVERFLEVTRATTKQGYLGRLRLLTRYDVRDRLSELRPPTLFLASELDHLVPSVEQARLMADRVPGATLRILDGHGHICLIAPDIDLSEILRAWQRDVDQSVASPFRGAD